MFLTGVADTEEEIVGVVVCELGNELGFEFELLVELLSLKLFVTIVGKDCIEIGVGIGAKLGDC